jgi:hypothetical protein
MVKHPLLEVIHKQPNKVRLLPQEHWAAKNGKNLSKPNV